MFDFKSDMIIEDNVVKINIIFFNFNRLKENCSF